jgi:hypothetical protein
MSFLFSFTKSENRRVEHVLTGVGGLAPVGAGRMWERAWEGEYNADRMYIWMLMEKYYLLKLFLKSGIGE